MSKKSILIYALSLVGVIAVVVSVIMLTREKETNAHNPEFAKYIMAYPSGEVSKQDKISIRLTDDTMKKLEAKPEILEKLFSFDPDIEGVTSIIGNMVQFIPEENLKSGKKYHAIFNLGKIVDVDSDIKKFAFNFYVKKQGIEFEIIDQETTDLKTLKTQKVTGIIKTADRETTENIAKTVEAYQLGEKLDITWKTDFDGTNHYFIIDNVKREEEETTLKISINGASIGADYEVTEKIAIPGFNSFELISSKVYNDPEQKLVLQFSDPILPTQNLDGLINIKNVPDVRYLIDNNLIIIYPPKQLKEVIEVSISENIKNVLGFPLGQALDIPIAFEELNPQVNFVGTGNILPSTDKGMIIPIEAVNLKAIDIAVIRIHENNIMQFLQNNDIASSYELRYVGQPVAMQTVYLDKFNLKNLGVKNKFYIDLNKIVKTQPGAIYRVMMKVQKKYSLYSGAKESADDTPDIDLSKEELTWANYEKYFGYDYYPWDEREDPTKEAYYYELKKGKNIISSNLGIIAKQSKNEKINVFITDLITAEPKENINVEIYNFQQQLLGNAITNNKGKVEFEKQPEAYFVIAKHGNEKGYLRLNDGESLNLSKFDVGGQNIKNGIKAFIYQERGVRRPGDSIYITLILDETEQKLPRNMAINLKLNDPLGKLVKAETQKLNETGFYVFRTATNYNAPTGDYYFSADVGTVKFSKTIKVETIKPNRLSIKLDFPSKIIKESEGIDAMLKAKWLHGMPAADMLASVDLTLNPITTTFKKYPSYTFDDPLKSQYFETKTIHNAKTDGSGNAKIYKRLNTKNNAGGMLRANFTMKVFEKGGNFSISQASTMYSPFEAYLGISTPEKSEGQYYYTSGKKMKCDFVLLDEEGKPIKDNHKIEINFFKLNWRWWWNASRDEISSYSFNNSAVLIDKAKVSLKNGKASWEVETDKEDWGRYLIWAVDPESGHSTGKIVYFDWPYRNDGSDNKEGATMLVFSTDKETYEIGDKAEVNFPSNENGNALITIENGTQIVKSFWTKTQKGKTSFKFDITPEMHPNAYVHVTLLQQYAQTANDLPIRMYGVMPITVENPNTILTPIIKMPDELTSEQTVKIQVSEKDNKNMTYTLALVDEGLLGITNFRTPNPANAFFAKEALGVKTWDIFNVVMGAQKGKAERLLAIGGGMGSDSESTNPKAQRFKPVVKFLGPFTLKGGSATHYVKIPKYIGALRTMVVAGSKNTAYGSAEKTTPVTKPLMLLSTLPRVVRPQEKIKMPVTVFAMKDNVKNATVTVKTDNLIKVVGETTKEVTFDQPGEKTINFDLEVLSNQGIAKVEIVASSKNNSSSEIVEIDVENPNPYSSLTHSQFLEGGKKWSKDFNLIGIQGTNSARLEVSSMPAFNLESRLQYLIRYPHGCIEQITSAAFPQLYLHNITKLTEEQKQEIDRNIKATIKLYNNYQLPNGGFAYWSGGRDASLWGTNYAGHFLVEAEKAGYPVSPDMMKKWHKFQKQQARNWTNTGHSSHLVQAYRLYTLALAGYTEHSAMNRLKNQKISVAAKWRLAAAYKIAGKNRTAKKMVEGLSTKVEPYNEQGYTFGSDLRDQAMILETLVLNNQKLKAFKVLEVIAKKLNTNNYYSTQTTAYSLIGISNYITKYAQGKDVKLKYTVNGKSETITSKTPVTIVDLNLSELKDYKLNVENQGNVALYVNLLLEGKPAIGQSVNYNNDLTLKTWYELPDGTSINPNDIKQGTDFKAYVKVSNPGLRGNYYNLALERIFPSGWEIINTRLFEVSDISQANSLMDYQDIRDDRVYTYFDLPQGKSKVFVVLLNATYAGQYWFPPVKCEAMYNHSISAVQGGKFVNVSQ